MHEWFDNTLLSRLNNKEKGVIVMQRLHQDDLVGHVLERGEWDVLNFLPIAEEDEHHVIETIFDAHHHPQGGRGHPSWRESLESLRRTREDIGFFPRRI